MALVELTADSFEKTVTQDGIVLVDLWASWCGPCMRFAPTYSEAAEQHPDITFAKVDTEAEGELAAQLQVQSIPTIMAFRDGILLYRDAGALSKTQLDQLITQVSELDMTEVKAKVAELASDAPES